MRPLRHMLFACLMMLAITASAQDSLFFAKAINGLDNQPAREKVYLHLDKPTYHFNDTIWYKAYTVIGQHHQLSALSGVLYVELISPKDSLVTRQILPLASGMTWSDIPLDYTLKPGVYRLRAYTRWMENGGPGYFDEQQVTLGGTPLPVKKTVTEKPDVQFFPEGGNLVNGVRSRIAVKSVGPGGLGQDIKGSIEDNTGNVVADFSTRHLGMGEFALTPEPGKSYFARISISGETAFTIELPAALQQGYTLSVNNSDKDTVYLRVATNEQTLSQDKDKSFYIIAQNNGKIYYTTRGRLDNTFYTAKVEKKRFPAGIAAFTLFDQAEQPIAERIAFINSPRSGLKLDLRADNPDAKIKLAIAATDPSGQSKQGSFSVAVINETKVRPNENDENTIINNLLLTSELKGYIEQPNYYFANQNETTEADLDNLLLTQGYRHYEWKQVLADDGMLTAPVKFYPERSQELTGMLTALNGKPLSNGKITLLSTKDNLFRDTTTDEQGRFTFHNLAIVDTATLVLKARKMNKGANVVIRTVTPGYPKNEPVPNRYAIATADTISNTQQYTQYLDAQQIAQLKFGKMLKTVKIIGVKKQPPPDLHLSANLNGPGMADQVIMWDQLNTAGTMYDALVGKLYGISLSPPGFKDTSHASTFRWKRVMAVIMDGQEVPDDNLDFINPNDVYSIEVLKSASYISIYGPQAAGGAIIITTKHGAYYTPPPTIGMATVKYKGFYRAKAFYVPKYDYRISHPEDTRTTTYWNPNVLTDKNGRVSLDYANSGQKGVFRVVVEGIDDDGNLGRAVCRFEVK